MRYIGDVHGNAALYRRIASPAGCSVQVGDFGLGFVRMPTLGGGHRFIRGNHDCPALCRERPDWIADGTVEGDTMFVGGASSIDRHQRIEGVSWWADEELSIVEFGAILARYAEARPRVMVTHECPGAIVTTLFPGHYRPQVETHSRTRQALDAMLAAHRPEVWIFGHWHQDRDAVIDGTRFICLAEGSFIDLPEPRP